MRITRSAKNDNGSISIKRKSLTGEGRASLGKLATKPVSCPAGTTSSRSFMSGRFPSTPLSARAYERGKQAYEFAGKHKGKLGIATVGGTAGAAYGINKTIKKRNRTQSYLLALSDSLRSLSSKNIDIVEQIRKEVEIDDIITWLEKNGGINTKDANGNTPLMMVIAAAGLSDSDKTEILDELLENGAKPGKEELKSALSLPSYYDVKELAWIRSVTMTPHITVLEAILPYYDRETLLTLSKVVNEKIDNLAHDLEYWQSGKGLEDVNNNLKYWRDARHEYPKWAEYVKKTEEEKEKKLAELNFKISSLEKALKNRQAKMVKKVEKIKPQLETYKQLRDIARNSLYKGTLSGTATYREEDTSLAR